MQLLVQNCLDPSRATEIFSVPKRRKFALPKIVRYQIKVDYICLQTVVCLMIFFRNMKSLLKNVESLFSCNILAYSRRKPTFLIPDLQVKVF